MPPREAVIDVRGAPSGSDIEALFEQRYGAGAYTVQGFPLHDLIPGVAPFTSGAVILRSAGPPGAGSPAAAPGHLPAPPLLLAVCSGPDAGRVVPLQRGRYIIGRTVQDGAGPGIGIADPALSRHHAELVVGAESVVIRDLGSANGTWVDGCRVRTAVVDTGTSLRLGYSQVRLSLPGASPEVPGTPPDLFQPLIVRLADQGQKTGLLLVGALLPLTLGVVLALVTGLWMSLAFSAVSAVTALLAAAGARRRRREDAAAVARAVEEDRSRRMLAAPDPGETALAAHAHRKRVGARYAAMVCPVRIGAATQPANLEVVPARPHFTPPQIPEAPVVLALGRDPDIRLDGSTAEVDACARTILMQASTAAGPRVVYAGTPSELELHARFLPGVTLAPLPSASTSAVNAAAATLRTALAGPSGLDGPAVRVLFVSRSWARYAAGLLTALPESLQTQISVVRMGGPLAAITVTLAPGRGTLVSRSGSLDFVPDLVQPLTFERLSRALAAAAVPLAEPTRSTASGELPSATAFGACHRLSPELLLRGWQDRTQELKAVVGVTESGPVTLALDKDGPHFLVAGTTGSGKSEFLRTFVASLAVSQPPSAFTFLLIDFKGGSGLAPLASLPHAVGLLTDLTAENVSRALVSLRAELRRRESLLSAAGVDNLAAYNSGRAAAQGLPRLLVVIDEFRMLADEVPGAVTDLLRIAAVGRSLGLHLLLATQRPQGAVSTDIRANIATSVALRVQSAAESRDVISTDSAAAIPPEMPGRAYLRKGSHPPQPFQSLSTSLRSGATHAELRELDEYFASSSVEGTETTADPDALDRLVSELREAAAAGGYSAPFPPVQQPLPAALSPELLSRIQRPAGADGILLGLLDEPGQQRLRDLSWHPRRDSHLAVLGAPRSGAPDCLNLTVSAHLAALPGRHLYVLDADGSLAWLAAAEQTGAYTGPSDTHRAARVLAYLAGQILHRLAPPAPTAAESRGQDRRSPAAGSGKDDAGLPPAGITLIITGWARWCTAFRSGRGLSGEEDLADLVRDGERADICVVLAGDREVLGARFFPLIPNRMFFPAEASAETLLLWPRLPPMDRVRGRALVQGRCGTPEGLSAQMLDPQLPVDPDRLPSLPPGSPRPHRIESLPAVVPPETLGKASSAEWLPVGVSGDELDTASVRIPSGSVFLVAGPRGSGRTSFLRQLRRSADPALCCLASSPEEVERAVSALEHRPDELRGFLLLVDDADSLPAPIHRKLADLQILGVRLALAGVSGHQLAARVPLALQVRSSPHGALLRPLAPADGDIFGVRIDPGLRRPPGRCYLVEGTDIREAQTAYSPAG
ncbi:FtsK/SpoIIIE domain-containing protein [Arthrobacter sp. zg-Y919]|nr:MULTISPECIES: FtsK/SpoIIIE domain-containing protein [unclassified Arthrobacter]MDK1277686.1 FtsK/SpoIIIE domain-containing protein [Arthrobacter sp. zg.Y919]WIB04570.1 FtsK/SpoIIIE domain-containing protein [Arthrobacter sp. zg-Y919]